ncbi:hypothetical protein ABQX22_00545 [Xanthomonas sp. WHRI 1810A]|uniref:hypothetical protein n=1 Tax=Xanthomonas sp. WHRI 1810A TaxID=3161565 RepID=UPI0032E8C19C
MTTNDDSDFDLGVPSEVEMFRHQCDMLIDELNDCWCLLRNSRQHVVKLVALNDRLAKELTTLKAQHEKVRWALSDKLLAEGLEAGRRLVPGSNIHTGYGEKQS